jgi:2-polyprenyl-3-methyl-5-hydroxy-6-metoxy-1,4-benzoquinol methylase
VAQRSRSTKASALKYDVAIDPTTETSHTRVCRLVGHGVKVLDLGCATGRLAELLVAQGCTVTGVELDPEAAKLAERHCEKVVVANLETDLSTLDDLGTFDVIVAADVLEHVTDPLRVLEAAGRLLAHHGYLVTSIPNIAHGSVRLALLAGKFPYSDLGLLDSTHLRFYTRSTMVSMLADGGFQVAYVEDQLLDPEQGEVLRDIDLEGLPPEARAAVRQDDDSAVYQFVAVSSPRGKQDGLLNALMRASERVVQLQQDLVKADRVLHDEVSRLALDLEAERRALTVAREDGLALRRVAILHEVHVDATTARLEALEAQATQLSALESSRVDLESEVHRLQDELRAIHTSRLWKFATVYRTYVGNGLRHR